MRRALLTLATLPLLAACNPWERARERKEREETRTQLAVLQARVDKLEEENREIRDRLATARAVPTPYVSPYSSYSSPLRESKYKCTESAGSYRMSRKDADAVFADTGSLATEARIVPFFKDGRSQGFKLYSIKVNSTFSSCGLMNGDVVKTVNGHAVDSPEKALEAYAKVKTASRISMELERYGKPHRLEIEVR